MKEAKLHFRFAVADLFEVTVKSGFMGDILEVADITTPHYTYYPVKLDIIDCKVMRCSSPNASPTTLFVAYPHAPWDNG